MFFFGQESFFDQAPGSGLAKEKGIDLRGILFREQ